jgi:uncharacterized membrane protein
MSEHELIVAAVVAVGVLLSIIAIRTLLVEYAADAEKHQNSRRSRTVIWLDLAGMVVLAVLAALLVLRIIAGLPHH